MGCSKAESWNIRFSSPQGHGENAELVWISWEKTLPLESNEVNHAGVSAMLNMLTR